MTLIAKALRQFNDIQKLGPGVLKRVVSMPDADGYHALHTKYGTFFYRRRQSDLSVIRQIYCQNEYDISRFPQAARIDKAYHDMARSDVTPVIIDCGANIGVSSRYFAGKYPHAQVLALEPDSENARLARANTKHLPNVQVIERAVGSAPGKVLMQTFSRHAWAARSTRSEIGTSVIEIRSLLAFYRNAVILIAKIDIEGFEADLFAANTEWVCKTHCIIAEPHDWHADMQGTSRNMMRVMGQLGYDLLISGENLLWIKPAAARIAATA